MNNSFNFFIVFFLLFLHEHISKSFEASKRQWNCTLFHHFFIRGGEGTPKSWFWLPAENLVWSQIEQSFSFKILIIFFGHIWWFFNMEQTEGTAELSEIIRCDKNEKTSKQFLTEVPKNSISDIWRSLNFWYQIICNLLPRRRKCNKIALISLKLFCLAFFFFLMKMYNWMELYMYVKQVLT